MRKFPIESGAAAIEMHQTKTHYRLLTVCVDGSEQLLAQFHRVERGHHLDILAGLELHVRQILTGSSSTGHNCWI